MFQAILKLLWDNAHLNNLPKHLIERALSEQLAILTDMTYNKDPNRRQYVLHCVDEIKAKRDCILPSVRHLHSICKSFSKSSASSYQKADKQTLGDLNRQHEIVKLLSMSLKHCHNTAVQVTERTGCVLKPDTLINDGYSHSAYVDGHLDLMKFFLKEGDLYLSWPRCRELWETLVENPKAIDFDKDKRQIHPTVPTPNELTQFTISPERHAAYEMFWRGIAFGGVLANTALWLYF